MKTTIALCLTFVFLSLARGQEAITLEQVVRRRDALLTEILDVIQGRHKTGTATKEEVRSAEINLYAFRRDSTNAPAERVQWQERILALEKDGKATVEKRIEIGLNTPFDGLLAEERVAAAEQKLLELRLAK